MDLLGSSKYKKMAVERALLNKKQFFLKISLKITK